MSDGARLILHQHSHPPDDSPVLQVQVIPRRLWTPVPIDPQQVGVNACDTHTWGQHIAKPLPCRHTMHSSQCHRLDMRDSWLQDGGPPVLVERLTYVTSGCPEARFLGASATGST
eukprot:GHUV01023401.1.p2 GENE.GHUV01023401.1~~GHUV01023401.1.p2  ORF type:complete len:115 (+),score=13.51 GHUV01023401.1:353-697(+)